MLLPMVMVLALLLFLPQGEVAIVVGAVVFMTWSAKACTELLGQVVRWDEHMQFSLEYTLAVLEMKADSNMTLGSCHVRYRQICRKFAPLIPLLPPPPFLSKHVNISNAFPHSSQKLQASKQTTSRKERNYREDMASTSAVSMAMPLTYASQKRVVPSSEAFFKPLPLRSSKAVAASKPNGRFQVRASMKEKVVTGLTAAD
ncbi:hypothetical protein E2542_SST01594 [Spatholobus suberectus]|nr:hypothetical protein E2542_SST01594 [Spatholobus suberectus]